MGYEEAYKKLADHPRVKEACAKVREKVREVHVIGYSFELVTEPGRNAKTNTTFRIQCPNGEQRVAIGTGLWIPVAVPEAKQLAEELFGAPGGTPTFFCQKKIAMDGGDVKKRHSSGKRWQEPFHDWLESRMRDDLSVERHEAELRVRRQMQEMMDDPKFDVERRGFLVRSAVESIGNALAAFSFLGKDVLKQALDEYIVHEITES